MVKPFTKTLNPPHRPPLTTNRRTSNQTSPPRSRKPSSSSTTPSSPSTPEESRWLSRGLALTGHKRAVHCVQLSHDYKWIASGSDDHRLCLWNTYTEQVVTLKGENLSGSISALDFSSDSKRLLSCHEDVQAVCVWDVETGCLTSGPHRLDTDSHTTTCGRQTPTPIAVFSPDATQIAVGGTDGHIHLLDSSTGTYLRTYHHTKRSVFSRATKRWVVGVTCLAFSPDGRKIASGSAFDTVCIWDKANGYLLTSLTHHHTVNSVVFAPSGRSIATASVDQKSRVWDVDTGVMLCSFVIPSRKKGIGEAWPGAVCVDFSPDGQKIATGSSDGMIYIHDVHSRSLLASLDWHVERVKDKPQLRVARVVFSVQFSMDGKRIISGGADKCIHIGYWRKSQRA